VNRITAKERRDREREKRSWPCCWWDSRRCLLWALAHARVTRGG